MIIEQLKQNIRLLEQLALFSTGQDEPSGIIPGTSEYLFLSVLKQLKHGELGAAQQQYKQLCDHLHVVPTETDGQLEPLRTLLHLKLWEGDDKDKKKLQQYLFKELGLNFEAEPLVPSVPPSLVAMSGAACDTQAAPTKPQLPTQLDPEQYSSTAFQALLSQSNTPPGSVSLTSQYDHGTLVDVIQNADLALDARVVLLQQGLVPPAVLPVQLLVELVQGWVATDSWNNTPATDWVTSNWDLFTTEQAIAVRNVLPGPPFGSNPKIDRPYIAALVIKALAGPAATAAGGSTAAGHVAAWSCGAADVEAAADLARVLEVCDELGPPADWIRLHALHAQLQLQLKQQPCVEMNLLVKFMQLLGRAAWSQGPTLTDSRGGLGAPGTEQQHTPLRFGGQQDAPQQQQQQQPRHVLCSVCGMRPIVGSRFRSKTKFGFNVCGGCVGSAQAVAAGPLEEVKVDDTVYMLPEVPLPDALGELPSSESGREALARRLLVGLVQEDGSQGEVELFKPDGPCPLAEAGLLLPHKWRDAAVAEAKLLAGRGNSQAWAQVYQKHADLTQLAQRFELSFADHNRSTYSSQEDVTLHLYTKNVGTQGVLVKVYDINCWNYYTTEGKEVDLNLELSGVAPSKTLLLKTPQNPVIRQHHAIPLGLAGVPGVWLVEVVANGQRVRARINKGTARMTQRPTAAGQVLTFMDENWKHVQAVRVWCGGKEYSSSPSTKQYEVLLPYSRNEETTPLVVAARLRDAPDRDCVVLFPEFQRLSEQYTLKAHLYCHQESLLPGQTVPLLLQLALQLHGRPAPLQLLQQVALRLTATTQDGSEVTQVFKDLSVDPNTCQLQLQYPLPQAATRLSAVLTARLLLTLPGINGEPDWQEFELSTLLPGHSGPNHSIEINSTAQTPAIWDVFLTTSTQAVGTAQPQYVLQVLGRSGEPPATPKTLAVWLSHVGFNAERKLHFRVQTGPGGVVHLGSLLGIRELEAQVESGIDYVETGDTTGIASGKDSGSGPTRRWQVARASWWQGGLQHEYTMPAGGTLELPLTPAAGQTLTAKLLQLIQPSKVCRSSHDIWTAPVHLVIASSHLQQLTQQRQADDAAAASGTSSSAVCLGSGSTVILKIHGLAAGLYRLVVPGLMLQPPSQAFAGQRWGGGSTNMAVHIHVLPSTTAEAAALDSTVDETTSAQTQAAAAAEAAAEQPSCWLWGDDLASFPGPAVLQRSPAQQLHIRSLTCSAQTGLSVQLTGTPSQLAAVQVVAVFSRFLHDGTVSAVQLLQNKLPWGGTGYFGGQAGFGLNDGLYVQALDHGLGSVTEKGLGYEGAPQACGDYGPCSYSGAAKLDSAVAYVLQRRQWEEDALKSGGVRPGSLLDKPSLLVMPRSVRSAASGTTVLQGGDGERVREKAKCKKKMMATAACGAAAPMLFTPSTAPYAQQQQQASCSFGAPFAGESPAFGFARAAECMPCPVTGYQGTFPELRHMPQAPALGFLKNSAVLLAGLEPGPDGSLTIPAEQLQQQLQQAAATAATGGSTTPSAPHSRGGSSAASSSKSSCDSVFGAGGYSVVYVAAYVLVEPGQFSSCFAAVQGAASADVAAQPEGRRDMGLTTDVDDTAISALTCDVLALQPGASLALPNADACEAAGYGSSQQLYHLLAGLLELAEAGRVAGLGGWQDSSSGALRALLPRPCLPPKAKGSSACALLRQWEPLLLHWHGLTTAARVELLGQLGSAEMAFYLACKDNVAYEQLLLPLLRAKLPSELCCLEQILLLQSAHNQPTIPNPRGAARPTSAAYAAAVQQLLQYWYAPHRYYKLTVLEQLLLCALEGKDALLQFGSDMRQQLETPEQKRGVKQSWMTAERRALFDFALMVHHQLEQQKQQQEQKARASDAATEAAADETEFAQPEEDDFVHVAHTDAAFSFTPGGGFGAAQHAPAFGAAAPPPPPAPAAAPALIGGLQPVPFGMPAPPRAARARMANDAADLAARQQLQAAAMAAANLAPKETQEWAEAGWWKCEGHQAPAALVPPSLFWADFAIHLASNPDQPFIPTDPTGAAASAAAITAALAVVGLVCEGTSTATANSSASSSSGGTSAVGSGTVLPGCSRSCTGSTLTLTARSPCLLWVKQVKAVASIGQGSTAAAAIQLSSAGGDLAGGGSSSGSASTVMVTERLYDPRFSSSLDPETGEQLLLSLQPTDHHPLLAGQAYCHSLVITSTGPAEQQLDILAQLSQGALPLAGGTSTTSKSITLAPYAMHQLTTTFYFPEAGVFKRAPVSVTKRGRPAWMPSAAPPLLHVVAKPLPGSPAKPQQGVVHSEFNWSQFLSSSSPDKILEYLCTGDLSVARLADLSPYCRDPAFFNKAITTLSARHIYEHSIWKWAVMHMDGKALQQLLPMSHLARRIADYGLPVANLLHLLPLSSSDVELRHLEYWPWVNPYCRPIRRADGADSSLPSVLADNPAIADQWRSFLLATLFDTNNTRSSTGRGSSNSLSLARAAAAACYLLLQDRPDDAELVLTGSDWEAAAAALQEGQPLRMQVDYLRAWLALARPLPTGPTTAAADAAAGSLAVAKEVVTRYKNVAAQPWLKRFAQLASMVKEVEQQLQQQQSPTAATGSAAETDSVAPMSAAVTSPGDDVMLSIVSCEGSKLKFTYKAIMQVTIAAYHIDTELLFTTQPFSSLVAAGSSSSKMYLGRSSSSDTGNSDSGLGKVAFVQPSAQVVLQLPLTAAVSDPAVAAAGLDHDDTAAAGGGTAAAVSSCVVDLDALMPDLASQSVLVELCGGGGVSRTTPRFASELSVHVYESQGVLQAYHTSAAAAAAATPGSQGQQGPAAAVYVKVFAKDRDGKVWFYKDGYTDLRGKFDYVTLTSTADMSRVSRYSLLVASPQLGAIMTQAAPTPRQ